MNFVLIYLALSIHAHIAMANCAQSFDRNMTEPNKIKPPDLMLFFLFALLWPIMLPIIYFALKIHSKPPSP